MSVLNQYKFEYTLEATDENPTVRQVVETPWVDDYEKEVENETIYSDAKLAIIESAYNNGFRVRMINTAEKSIMQTNWELDYVKPGHYLPKIQ